MMSRWIILSSPRRKLQKCVTSVIFSSLYKQKANRVNYTLKDLNVNMHNHDLITLQSFAVVVFVRYSSLPAQRLDLGIRQALNHWRGLRVIQTHMRDGVDSDQCVGCDLHIDKQ